MFSCSDDREAEITMAILNQAITAFNDFVYGYILVYVLLAAGIYFSFRSRFMQIRHFRESCHLLFEKNDDSNATTGFQAVMVSLASRVGVGTIAGVATALAAGGSGAVFWMWITAVFGGATALVESTLAQLYKQKTGPSRFRGGPAYYMKKAFHVRWVGLIFSISLLGCYAYGSEALQANLITSSLQHYFGTSQTFNIVMGIILSAATAYAIFGGQKHIAKITSVLVPVMGGVYIIFTLVIIICNAGRLPGVFADIFRNAFNFREISAGVSGSCVMWGVKRGLFSNEAGMGSAPNAAATVETSHPVKQGLIEMLAVYIGTIILCSCTALMVLCTGVDMAGKSALPLVQEAVSGQFGEFGVLVITFSVFMFAFSTIIGNYYYTEPNVEYILNRKSNFVIFRISIILFIFLGCVIDTSLAWNIADTTIFFMTIVNVPTILVLSGKFMKTLKNYEDQQKRHQDPYFLASAVSIEDTDYWKESDRPEIEKLVKSSEKINAG